LYSRPAAGLRSARRPASAAVCSLSLSSEIQHTAAAERLADGLDEPLQELLSDHASGACRHGAAGGPGAPCPTVSDI
jgi:hypothetical protein